MLGGGQRSLAIAAVACLLPLAACGGDDQPQSEAAFLKTFKTATADYRERTDALKQEGRAALGRGATALLGVYESMLGTVSETKEQFGALNPPKGLAKHVDALVGNLDAQERALRQVIDSVKANRTDQLGSSLQELAALLVDFARVHQRIQRQLD